jgi:hypothetical protein
MSSRRRRHGRHRRKGRKHTAIRLVILALGVVVLFVGLLAASALAVATTWLDDLHPAFGEDEFFFEPFMRDFSRRRTQMLKKTEMRA